MITYQVLQSIYWYFSFCFSIMNNWQNSTLIAAAIGATVGVISAATAIIYNKILEEKQHSTMSSNIENVNRKVAELKAELETFRYSKRFFLNYSLTSVLLHGWENLSLLLSLTLSGLPIKYLYKHRAENIHGFLFSPLIVKNV